jgi:hypothetical protein
MDDRIGIQALFVENGILVLGEVGELNAHGSIFRPGLRKSYGQQLVMLRNAMRHKKRQAGR